MEHINNYRVLKEKLQYYEKLYKELDIMENLVFDQVTILDNKTKFLFVGKPSEDFFGLSEKDLLGKYANNMKSEGIIDKSITMEVLRKKEKTTIIQHTASNKTLMVVGFPIFNQAGQVVKVINISKDITNVQKIKKKVQGTNEVYKWIDEQIQKQKVIEKNEILSKNSKMEKIIDLIKRTADLDTTVLLLGETGVGKGFLANIIYQVSNRNEKPFITINCGAIPENLLESELFGYVGGSFTGADKKGKKGLFEIAKDGTIFLDEIGEMPMKLQVKLLNVLQDRKANRIGSLSSYEIKARIIAATNKDLEKAIEKGEFRKDLYYRLNVLSINIPSLKERREDIPLLINSFIEKYNKKYNMRKILCEDAYNMLISYDWPGNIRELENVIERLVITSNERLISHENILDIINPNNSIVKLYDDTNKIFPLKEATRELEKRLIIAAKQKHKTTRKMANVLKIDQSTVVRKMQEYNIK